MPQYETLPDKKQWEKDNGVTFLSKDPPIIGVISKLLEMVRKHKGATKREIIFQIWRLARYGTRHGFREEKAGAFTFGQRDAFMGLQACAKKWLKLLLDCDDEGFEGRIMQEFGREVDEAGANSDVMSLNTTVGEQMVYLREDNIERMARRRSMKLSFRGGLAYKKRKQQEEVHLDLYDTERSEQNVSLEGAGDLQLGTLYVMDKEGRIYVAAQSTTEGLTLKHSSFLAGGATLAAGTIRFKDGQLVWVSGESGHYKPTVTNMINVLERFRGAYQVKLDKVQVRRRNSNVPAGFEAIMAKDLLKERKWLGYPGFEQAMYVPRINK